MLKDCAILALSAGWPGLHWVTSLKSRLPGTDLLLTFNRVRILYVTVFSLFAFVVALDTVYPVLSCYLCPFEHTWVIILQTAQGGLNLLCRLLHY